MATALGLVGLVIFIVCVVALAAAVTWLVVRFTPTPGSRAKNQSETPADS